MLIHTGSGNTDFRRNNKAIEFVREWHILGLFGGKHMFRAYGSLYFFDVGDGLKSIPTKLTEPMALQILVRTRLKNEIEYEI